MKDVTLEERMLVWLTQSQRFADQEKWIDAIGRAKACIQEIDKALATITEADELRTFSKLKLRANEMLASFEEAYEKKNVAIRNRRMQAAINAEAEMTRPLPMPKDKQY